MLDSRDQSNSRSGIFFVELLRSTFSLEIHIPEFDVKLGVGSESGDEDVSSFRRPEDGVGSLVVESLCGSDKVSVGDFILQEGGEIGLTELNEITLSRIESVIRDTRLEQHTRGDLSVIRIVRSDEHESLSLGFPSKCSNGVCQRVISDSIVKVKEGLTNL